MKYRYKNAKNAISRRMQDFAEHVCNDAEMTKYEYSFVICNDNITITAYKLGAVDFDAQITTCDFLNYEF